MHPVLQFVLFGLSACHVDASAPPSVPSAVDPGHAAVSARIQALRAAPEWLAFEAVWRRLDAVEPRKGNDADGFLGAYGGVASEDPSLPQEVKAAADGLPALVKDGRLTAFEARALAQLLQERSTLLVMGPIDRMTRMIPSPTVQLRSRTLPELEARIDVLNELAANGTLDPAQRDAARARVLEEVRLLVVLEAGDPASVGFGALVPQRDPSISEEARALAEFDATASTPPTPGNEAVHLAAVEARDGLPALLDLVGGLEP